MEGTTEPLECASFRRVPAAKREFGPAARDLEFTWTGGIYQCCSRGGPKKISDKSKMITLAKSLGSGKELKYSAYGLTQGPGVHRFDLVWGQSGDKTNREGRLVTNHPRGKVLVAAVGDRCGHNYTGSGLP